MTVLFVLTFCKPNIPSNYQNVKQSGIPLIICLSKHKYPVFDESLYKSHPKDVVISDFIYIFAR